MSKEQNNDLLKQPEEPAVVLKKPQRAYKLYRDANKQFVNNKEEKNKAEQETGVRSLALTSKSMVRAGEDTVRLIQKKRRKSSQARSARQMGTDDSLLVVNDDDISTRAYNMEARQTVRTGKNLVEIGKIIVEHRSNPVRQEKAARQQQKEQKKEQKKDQRRDRDSDASELSVNSSSGREKENPNKSLLGEKGHNHKKLVRHHTVKGLLKANVVAGIKNIESSDDLGVQAFTKTRNAAIRTKQVAHAAAQTARTVKWMVKAAAKVTNMVFKAVASVLSMLLPALPILLLVIVCIVVIVAVVPSLSLKSTDEELSKTYKYVTELDASFVVDLQNEKYGADVYHYYLNGSEVNQASIDIKTNPDSVLAYLDAKYEDYALDKIIYGLFGGTNVKDEIKQIHQQLYHYTTDTYTKTISAGEDEDGNEVTEEKVHKDISITTNYFDSWVYLNRNTLFDKSQSDAYDLLQETGIYTTKKEIGSPFPGKPYPIAKRYGFSVDMNETIFENNGIDISCEVGKGVAAGINGTVTDVGSNYVTLGYKKREVVYSAIKPTVDLGQEIKKGDIVGRTTDTDLHIRFYKGGKEMCPNIFLQGIAGYAGTGHDGSTMVQIALSQLGQAGGRPYWSWYGFGGRVEWCAIFVSWCADQAGFLDQDIIFKHASCTAGVEAWRSRSLFQNRASGYVPKPGDLIYFVWTPGDSGSDHVGIVESSNGSVVYTIEGNSGDAVRQNAYNLFDPSIIGYATPLYPSDLGGYSEEDLYWLSRVINAEAGSEWLADSFQQDVGSVVLNRTKDARYPNAIKDVIFQKGQYECVQNGKIYDEPNAKSIANAKNILRNGSTLPSGVVGQSQFVQGEIYSKYFDPVLGTTTYFCYM